MPSNNTVTMTIRIPESLVAQIDVVAELAECRRSAAAVKLIRRGLSRDSESRNSDRKDVVVDSLLGEDDTEETDHE